MSLKIAPFDDDMPLQQQELVISLNKQEAEEEPKPSIFINEPN